MPPASLMNCAVAPVNRQMPILGARLLERWAKASVEL
jgi:hypothetical protein